MKTEQLIVQYLYKNKKVTLQDIGVFNITADIIIPEDSDKDIVLPADAIQFEFDPKAPVDDGLVAFIMESTRKIRPLAYSDLESFIILNKQFLNIGKPMVFEGLGTLQKTQAGAFTFVQANTSHVTNEEMPKVVTEKLKEKVSFATPQKEKAMPNGKLTLWIILGFVAIAIGATVFYFIIKKSNESSADNRTTTSLTDTLPNATNTVVSNSTTSDTLSINKVTAAPQIKDSNSFYIVIKEFNDVTKAKKSLERLLGYGNNVQLYTKDSSSYKLRMPFRASLTDTLRTRDSISKFFKANALVELP